ncbi:MAG: Flp pilus assembly complex ATPase component TadA [Myxococcales bacterium]|nr:Flp pilus assembly complex ATPase component TadA [Myxococcales bacterium]
MPRKKVRIGELLVQNAVITEEQLMTALANQKKTGLKLGRQLITEGFLDEDRFLSFLSEQLRIPCIDLSETTVDGEVVRIMSETYARRFRAIVLEDRKDHLLVGMADPTNIFALDEIERTLKRNIQPAVVRESEIIHTIDMVYRKTEEISSIAEELDEELHAGAFDLSILEAKVEESDAPVVRLLKTIFEDAVQIGSSDIHIEPDETVLRIRHRVDGVLQEQVMKERRISAALVLRLKLMSGLDISEKRLPQDGRFNIRVNDKSIDVRLSTMPVAYGESVVIRLLDQSEEHRSLDHIGMPEKMLTRFRTMIHRPHGLILVTGPTGSGKTTTLYAALTELNLPSTKIITVEDPVEYRISRLNQVQVKPKIGLTFSTVLRAALRQDPDIVMIGEMRDQETAEIGMRAAMTGHLVFATLHTNDAPSTASRILDMGVEGFLVATALRAVIAQRLIRRLCEGCIDPYPPSAIELDWIRSMVGAQADGLTFKTGKGCPRCNGTGYKGRIGVYEYLEVSPDMAMALRNNDSVAYAKAAYEAPGYQALSYRALEYAARGVTSIEEVVRVTGEIEDTRMEYAANPRPDERN